MSTAAYEYRLNEIKAIASAREFITLINRRINDTHGKWDLPRELDEPRIAVSRAFAELDGKIPDGSL